MINNQKGFLGRIALLSAAVLQRQALSLSRASRPGPDIGASIMWSGAWGGLHFVSL